MGKFVIFDMDGVLVDSEYIFSRVKTAMLRQRGHDVNESYQDQFIGMTYEAEWTIIKRDFNLIEPLADLIAEVKQGCEEVVKKDGVNPIPGVLDLVKRLRAKGYQLAVASSSPKPDIIRNLKQLGILADFQTLVSGEEVAYSKPAPDVFLQAAQDLGAAPTACFVFEDSTSGSQAAKAAGMICIGYANPSYPPQDLTACDLIIADYKDCYDFLGL
ncbi:HAD family hydrolase [Streptococcus dentapri]|uniref:HAD family hydrolase n=1 Tax=Streptococcus dentapri TaxID=573564 RepID=A0ABV8D1W6_9STRE